MACLLSSFSRSVSQLPSSPLAAVGQARVAEDGAVALASRLEQPAAVAPAAAEGGSLDDSRTVVPERPRMAFVATASTSRSASSPGRHHVTGTFADGAVCAPKVRHRVQVRLPYACSEASSSRSDWRGLYPLDAATSLSTKNLLKNDISRASALSPGVCVIRQASLPTMMPHNPAEFRLAAVTKALRNAEKEDLRARAAFASRDTFPSDGCASNENLPKQQVRTHGKPSICRPMECPEKELLERALAKDSLFSSENRAKYYWRKLSPKDQKDMKQHTRPLDEWQRFRQMADMQSSTMRAPFRSY